MIARGQEITPALRDEWLAERRKSLGASEAAAALGLDPRRSPLELYLEKIGLAPPDEPGEAAQWGLKLEPLIAEAWEERTGRRIVARQVFKRHRQDPFTATLDAVAEPGTVLELKTISALRARDHLGAEGTDELPEPWVIQAHMQMLLAEVDRVDFAVLVGGQQFRMFEVRREDRLLSTILPRLRAFWSLVEARVPPAPTVAADDRLMAALYPNVDGAIELAGQAATDAQVYFELGRSVRDLEKRRQELRAGVLHAMGSAGVAIVPGYGTLTRRVVKVDEAAIQRKAYSFVDLRLTKAKDDDGQG